MLQSLRKTVRAFQQPFSKISMRLLTILLALPLSMSAFAASEPDESDPLGASVVFYSQSYAIERMQGWCIRQNLGSPDAIAKARADWNQRHARLWEKAPKILQSQLSQQKRIDLAVRARLDNDSIENRLADAPVEQRRSWCEGLPAKISSPEMDMMSRPILVRAITGATQ